MLQSTPIQVNKSTPLAALLPLLLLTIGCGRESDPTVQLSGKELAQQHCQSCHLLPDPDLLAKATWQNAVLPRMGYRFGIYDAPGVRDTLLEPGLAGHLVREAGIFPESPTLPAEVWEKLVDYYLSAAPESLSAPPARAIREGLPGFRARVPKFRLDPPLTTAIAIDPQSRSIYLGDTKQNVSRLELLGQDGRSIQTIGLESAPSHIRVVRDSAYVLLTGGFLPTDEPSGLLRKLYRSPGSTKYGGAIRVLQGLFRPVHASYADLNGDGREDVVVSEFGFNLGRLAWYERTATDEFVRHVLRPLPGAISTHIRDVDGDDQPDILALMSQGDEGIFLYRNLGGGQFREEALLRFPATYGSTSFELHDFNGDGHFDILYSNGDNGDYDPTPKPYHGVRIFLNDGQSRFTEAYFSPIHGVYGTRARDFDADGDLDIAVVAFYPNYSAPGAKGFVYLENKGDLFFEAFTFPEAGIGRWITLDAGDVDGDGDEDIVLGSFVGFEPEGDATGLWHRWLRDSPSYLVLENTTK